MGPAQKFLAFICFLFFGIVCYKLLTNTTHRPPSVSQAAFAQALSTGKIQSVSIFTGYTLADLKYVAKDASNGDVSDVPTKDLPALIKLMMNNGVIVEFASARKMEKTEFILENLPLVLLILAVGYIFLIQRGKRA